ncbi:MAG TPA: hypothetical protein VGN52_18290 [Burkholderiales bacterium]|jgi:hypothetical protein
MNTDEQAATQYTAAAGAARFGGNYRSVSSRTAGDTARLGSGLAHRTHAIPMTDSLQAAAKHAARPHAPTAASPLRGIGQETHRIVLPLVLAQERSFTPRQSSAVRIWK